jgi:hypothetical protein
MEGQGVLVGRDGRVVYQGQWQAGLYHGQGTLYYPDSEYAHYQGQFKQGAREGLGWLTLREGGRREVYCSRDQVVSVID